MGARRILHGYDPWLLLEKVSHEQCCPLPLCRPARGLITGHLPSQEKKSREFVCKKARLILDLSLLPELDAGETSERTTGFWYGEVDGCTWDIDDWMKEHMLVERLPSSDALKKYEANYKPKLQKILDDDDIHRVKFGAENHR